jgi:hypothetical protein
MAPTMSDVAEHFRASLFLLGLYGLLNGAQWLADHRRWRDAGALGWDLQGLRRGRLWRLRVTELLYRSSGLRWLALLLLLASAMLIAGPATLSPVPPLLLFLASTILLALRAEPDGADKIAQVSAAGLLLQAAGVATANEMLILAGLIWVGGQLTLAYFAAGASKLILAPWRNGEALQAVLRSAMWGNGWSARLIERHDVARWLSWGIILLEIAFPFALLLPLPFLGAILAIFFLFHMAIALVMGLNSYPWAFLATYPSVILLSGWLRHMLGLG